MLALLARGYEVTAMTPADGGEGELAALGVDHVPTDLVADRMAPIADFKLFLTYCFALRRMDADAFLAFTPKPNAFGSFAAHALGVPVINNMTGMAFVERGWVGRTFPLTLLRLAFRKSRMVFFQNPDDLELFVGKRIVSRVQAGLLPGSGIDLSKFQPAPPAPKIGDDLHYLMIARLIREKGVLEYVEAARTARMANPHLHFHLLGFLGVANHSAISAADVQGWEREGVIQYAGSAADVRAAISEADCIVLPSYREGLPRVLLEGAAMGKPLIATDVPGCRSVVQDSVNGFLCEARSGASLAQAILKFSRLGDIARARMGEAALKKVNDEYDENIVIDEYLSALDAVLGPSL